MGLATNGITATKYKGDDEHAAGAIVMFKLQGGLILALYPRRELGKDARRPVEGRSATEFSIGHLVGSKEEVDRLLETAASASATVTETAHERPWVIYSGYFQDPDGHLWEIIWNHG